MPFPRGTSAKGISKPRSPANRSRPTGSTKFFNAHWFRSKLHKD
jgi:hypothetical protein